DELAQVDRQRAPDGAARERIRRKVLPDRLEPIPARLVDHPGDEPLGREEVARDAAENTRRDRAGILVVGRRILDRPLELVDAWEVLGPAAGEPGEESREDTRLVAAAGGFEARQARAARAVESAPGDLLVAERDAGGLLHDRPDVVRDDGVDVGDRE